MNTPDTIHFTKEANDKRSAAYADALRIEKLAALDRLIASVEAGTWKAPLHPIEVVREFTDFALAYRGSLDASLRLKDALLPGRLWTVEDLGGEWEASASTHISQSQSSPACALLLATLKAYRHTVAEGVK